MAVKEETNSKRLLRNWPGEKRNLKKSNARILILFYSYIKNVWRWREFFLAPSEIQICIGKL